MSFGEYSPFLLEPPIKGGPLKKYGSERKRGQKDGKRRFQLSHGDSG
jgi:hypothetical protein